MEVFYSQATNYAGIQHQRWRHIDIEAEDEYEA